MHLQKPTRLNYADCHGQPVTGNIRSTVSEPAVPVYALTLPAMPMRRPVYLREEPSSGKVYTCGGI